MKSWRPHPCRRSFRRWTCRSFLSIWRRLSGWVLCEAVSQPRRRRKPLFLPAHARWPIIGLAMFAANISTVHLVSFAETAYKYGMVFGNFEWMAGFTLVLLSLFFAPLYFRSRVPTLPDFIERPLQSPLPRLADGCLDLFGGGDSHWGGVVHGAACSSAVNCAFDPALTQSAPRRRDVLHRRVGRAYGALYDGRRPVGRRLDGEHPDGALAARRLAKYAGVAPQEGDGFENLLVGDGDECAARLRDGAQCLWQSCADGRRRW